MGVRLCLNLSTGLCTFKLDAAIKNYSWQSYLQICMLVYSWVYARFCFFPNCGHFVCFVVVFAYFFVACFVLGCQYPCNWFPGKTCLWNDLLCADWYQWYVKLYSLGLECLCDQFKLIIFYCHNTYNKKDWWK